MMSGLLTFSCDSIFFFFQAEDGIRDIGVTGVQTWLFRSVPGGPALAPEKSGRQEPSARRGGRHPDVAGSDVPQAEPARGGRARVRTGREMAGEIPRRSEERRVGKECRSRWSLYH